MKEKTIQGPTTRVMIRRIMKIEIQLASTGSNFYHHRPDFSLYNFV